MLLDLIQVNDSITQNRIGANGKERQSKLEYNFKQIINSLFPAGHRYFMHSAVYKKDLFAENVTPETLVQAGEGKWTKNLYEELGLSQDQIDGFSKMKDKFVKKRSETVSLI